MHALDEKNVLTQELENTRKLAEELNHEKKEIMKQLSKTRLEIDNYKRQLLQQVRCFCLSTHQYHCNIFLIIGNSF